MTRCFLNNWPANIGCFLWTKEGLRGGGGGVVPNQMSVTIIFTNRNGPRVGKCCMPDLVIIYSKKKGEGDFFSFCRNRKFLCMYVPHGVTQVTRGVDPTVRSFEHILFLLFQLFQFRSGFRTRRTRLVLFRCLLVLTGTCFGSFGFWSEPD